MMENKPALVVTSIFPPSSAMRALADGAKRHGFNFVVIGDTRSPETYDLRGADFWSLERQYTSGLTFAVKCPIKHYARKNVGYLIASKSKAPYIVETDDDNIPLEAFWNLRSVSVEAALIQDVGWCNVYQYFTRKRVWPRGLPLEHAKVQPPMRKGLTKRRVHSPVQQGLADENPDVDAVYRLLFPLPVRFRKYRPVALAGRSYCPFNSQNTTWFPDAYPLLYLPAYCSFRMTDIWRSFVALRVCIENGWPILFHSPTVLQNRNEHNLIRDFADEVCGYLQNGSIVDTLLSKKLCGGVAKVKDDVVSCYHALIEIGVVKKEEMKLLELWLDEM